MLKEYDTVVLTTDLPAEGLAAGDVGAIVHVYPDQQAFEVEFLSLDGSTIAVVTLERSQVRAATSRDVTHARTITV